MNQPCNLQFWLFFFLIKFFLLIYLFLAALGLHCCARAFSSSGLLIAVASLVAEHGLQARRLSSCGLRALECRLSSWWCMGLVAPWHVGSSWTRARTCVPCIGRRILNHSTTKEAQGFFVCFCFLLLKTNKKLQ